MPQLQHESKANGRMGLPECIQLIIEVQKKVAVLLGNPIPNIQIDEEN
jgi:hypothetical protein